MLSLISISAFAMAVDIISLERLTSPLHTDYGNAENYALSSIPGLCFFCTFAVLVAHWAELYYLFNAATNVERGDDLIPRERRRRSSGRENRDSVAVTTTTSSLEEPYVPAVVDDAYSPFGTRSNTYERVFKPGIVSLVLCSWIFYFVFVFVSNENQRRTYRAVTDGYFATIFAVLAISVVYYGTRTLAILRIVPIDRELRMDRHDELWTMTVLCAIAFVLRSVFAAIVAAIDTDSFTQTTWYALATAYFLGLEVFPLLALLWFLRRMPPETRIEAVSFNIVLSSDVDEEEPEEERGGGWAIGPASRTRRYAVTE
eukprot:g2302.t1